MTFFEGDRKRNEGMVRVQRNIVEACIMHVLNLRTADSHSMDVRSVFYEKAQGDTRWDGACMPDDCSCRLCPERTARIRACPSFLFSRQSRLLQVNFSSACTRYPRLLLQDSTPFACTRHARLLLEYLTSYACTRDSRQLCSKTIPHMYSQGVQDCCMALPNMHEQGIRDSCVLCSPSSVTLCWTRI